MNKKYSKEVKMEIGFIPIDWVYKKGVKIFKKVELIEVSLAKHRVETKEVKRMSRPYLEVKVVPVKKKKEQEYITTAKINGKSYGFLYYQGEMVMEQIKKKELKTPKDYWVNGENLDKIKFPAFCSFIEDGARKYGEINVTYNEHIMKDEYLLSDITEQSYKEKAGHTFSVRYSSFSLKDLIKCQDIHILKAKIILFEEKNK